MASRRVPVEHRPGPHRLPAVTPGPALPAHLTAGYLRFRQGHYAVERERYRELADGGQHPSTMIIACSDSRSGPEAVFDARPGELFVVRNVAALVPEYAPDDRAHAASAALEYAVLAVGVTSIVVMGHGRCGGIAAAESEATPLSSTDFIGRWVESIRALVPAAAEQADDDPVARSLALERASIEHSIANLRTFPWIGSRERSGELQINGAWFDIALGELHALGPTGWAVVGDDA